MTNEKLTFSQRQAINKLNEAIDEGLRRGLIILQGPFQSGKTQTVLEILRQRAFPVSENYLNLNPFLLFELAQQMKVHPELNLHILSRLKVKTSQIFERAIQRFLENFFQTRNFLVIDAVELLLNYPVSLPQLAYNFCRDSNTIILVVPHDLNADFVLNWTYPIAKFIELN
jgi:Cft2 family RNA processing exonuclease